MKKNQFIFAALCTVLLASFATRAVAAQMSQAVYNSDVKYTGSHYCDQNKQDHNAPVDVQPSSVTSYQQGEPTTQTAI